MLHINLAQDGIPSWLKVHSLWIIATIALRLMQALASNLEVVM